MHTLLTAAKWQLITAQTARIRAALALLARARIVQLAAPVDAQTESLVGHAEFEMLGRLESK